MTPGEFITKWRPVELKERSAAQAHFIDLCRLLGIDDPVTADPRGEWFTFEKGAARTTGGEGWADVWRRGAFAWEYKGRHRDLDAAFVQLQRYAVALENPPLLIVSDTDRIRIHTNWTNTVPKVHLLALDDLADASRRDLLRRAFLDPERLKPDKTRQVLTEEAAERFAALAQRLRARNHDAQAVAHFVNRLVFCMFAEDVGLLPDRMFERMLAAARARPEAFAGHAATLFAAMRAGGMVGFEAVERFNGGLFDDDAALPLGRDDIADLAAAAALDWSAIDPSILGTLFERGLDPGKRSQLGAHYTDRDKIMQIIGPVIEAPLLAEWEAVKARIAALMAGARTRGRMGTTDRATREATALKSAFKERLRAFRVLDPACGSGNFLYLALAALKDIERRVNIEAEALGVGLGSEVPLCGPENLLGIELNPYAAELARVSVWIGDIQWSRRNGFEAARNPILRPLETIECRDAVLAPGGTRAAWPAADAVVGNPPFLGNKKMIGELGEGYTRRLRAAYPEVPGGADLVCYWFAQAWAMVTAGTLARAGLVATNSIRGGANRAVLQPVTGGGRIFAAWSDQPWTVDGAAVRVSLVCFDGQKGGPARLDGAEVAEVFADLTAALGGVDLTKAARLAENAERSFVGIQKTGSFNIPGETARAMLKAPLNPNNRPNSDVLRPYWNGVDLARRPQDIWLIDFPPETREGQAALYEQPFAFLEKTVKPERAPNKIQWLRENWWLLWRPRPEMREATACLARFIVTPEVAKHRLFVWMPKRRLPDKNLMVIARDDDTTFGILHSRFHELWALRMGTSLEDRPRYTPSTTFETFPFPQGLTPDIPAAAQAADPRAQAIGAAAARLNELREAWLNPADLVVRTPEVVPGYPDRLLPRDAAAAAVLKTRTLTALYNARPAWLAHAHAALDAAVADAYGWGADWRAGPLADDDILARLFALNQARAAAPRR